jgi:hypothetical protein
VRVLRHGAYDLGGREYTRNKADSLACKQRTRFNVTLSVWRRRIGLITYNLSAGGRAVDDVTLARSATRRRSTRRLPS